MPRSSDARSKMVRTAAVLQRDRGVAGLALSEVIEASGAPRGSIYHHFPGGKAQLVAEATAYAGALVGDAIDAMVRAVPAGDVEALFTGFATYWADVMEKHRFRAGCTVAAGALDADDAGLARTEADVAFDRWERAIAARLFADGASEERADDLATTAVAAFEGALLLSRVRLETEPLHRVAREMGRAARAAVSP